MRFQLLVCLLFNLHAYAETQSAGRKPAVEDFVGIDIEHAPEVTPQGTDALFNFEKDMSDYELKQHTPPQELRRPTTIRSPSTYSWNLTLWMGLIFILSLPILSWLTVMSHLRRKANLENASNIEILERYRKEREEGKKSEKIKKAS